MRTNYFTKYKNIVKDLDIVHPEQVFVSDITYIPLSGNLFAYAAFITDAFSRKIMGFSVSDKLDSTLAVEALIIAISNSKYNCNLIHHSPSRAHLSTGFINEGVMKSKCKPFFKTNNPQKCKPISGQESRVLRGIRESKN